jgi:cation-transporting ATPase G
MNDACCDHEPPSARSEAEQEPERLWQVSGLRFAGAAGVLLASGYAATWAGAPAAAGLAFKVGALSLAAWTFVPGTLRRVAHGRIGVGALMTIAAVGAVVLGEIGEAATLAVLYAIAEGLEEHSLARARRGLRSLLELVPARATVLRDGVELDVAPDELRVGDSMVVKPGERVATDGTVMSGRTALNMSAITGESVPMEVSEGDEVFAGSINGTAVLEVRVTTTTQDNSLARIVRIVEEEQARKGTSQRLADRVARPLVPGVLVAAALIAATGSALGDPLVWTHRALVVLVAASPCALAISVPVTMVAAVGAASRFGVLIKGGAALEGLGSVRTVALDKTGTLTRNDPAVVQVATTSNVTREQVIDVSAALEARSEHPLASAILAECRDPGAATDVDAVTGAGLTGRVDGRPVRLGRPGWIDSGALTVTVERMQAAGASVVLVEDDGRLLGAIAVRDDLRAEAADVVAMLRRDGHQVAMLTGDNIATATALARETAIDVDAVHAELRPEDKAGIIGQLSAHQPTAMVGDGVNDAPALATADIGIAMGAMGADVAIETADVALMGEDLRHLLGALGLAAVVLVHEVAEVMIIGNGLRAGRAPQFVATAGGVPLADRVNAWEWGGPVRHASVSLPAEDGR